MQQLTIVHKKVSKTNNNSKVVSETKQTEEIVVENQREVMGAALITSRRMYRLENSNIFYIESSKDNVYYYCKYSFSSTGFKFCSCKDFEIRGRKEDCKHLRSIPFGIMKGVIVDVEKLPSEAKRYPVVKQSKSYEEDEYSF